jgi:hypothetical protein
VQFLNKPHCYKSVKIELQKGRLLAMKTASLERENWHQKKQEIPQTQTA